MGGYGDDGDDSGYHDDTSGNDDGGEDVDGAQRSVHMCIWSEDGKHILVTNLHGKMIERIDVVRNGKTGEIENLEYNLSAGVYLGKNWNKLEDATVLVNVTGGPTYHHDGDRIQRRDLVDYSVKFERCHVSADGDRGEARVSLRLCSKPVPNCALCADGGAMEVGLEYYLRLVTDHAEAEWNTRCGRCNRCHAEAKGDGGARLFKSERQFAGRMGWGGGSWNEGWDFVETAIQHGRLRWHRRLHLSCSAWRMPKD